MLRPLLCVLLGSAVLLCNAAPLQTHGEPNTKCPLMVKVLDAVKGAPAGSVALKVSRQGADGEWQQVANGVTDVTGEAHNLITDEEFPAGIYRVEFDTKAFWKSQGSTPFHEVADVPRPTRGDASAATRTHTHIRLPTHRHGQLCL
ncbi:transthyretin isoform X3 [Lampris incognitus]|uniref:transthyretin isoform X3 n=1 Tax=Lampris incognitus TaxID=2546036 RepID=UPI0024B4E79E|nr:transthyretin isoform X3 [Lampris incognitus]